MNANGNVEDFTVSNHGSILLFSANNKSAYEHLRSHVGPEAQWFGDSLAVEPRYADQLVDALLDDGWVVG